MNFLNEHLGYSAVVCRLHCSDSVGPCSLFFCKTAQAGRLAGWPIPGPVIVMGMLADAYRGVHGELG